MRLAIAWLISAAALLSAGGGPETTVVVVNEDSWASLTVAQAWCRLRGIPERNVVRLSDLSDWEEMSWPGFCAEVLHPLRQGLVAQGLQHVETIALAPDIPFSVELSAMPGYPDIFPIGPFAASTAVVGLFLWRDPASPAELMAPGANRYAMPGQRGRVASVVLDAAAEQIAQQAYQAGWKDGHWADAIAGFERVLAAGENADQRYNLACARARAGDPEGALADLAKAIDAGWIHARHTAEDGDLASLHDRPAWKPLLARMRPDPGLPMPATRSLAAARRDPAWPADARPVPTIMLPPTTGRCLSVDGAVALLERCRAADGVPPAGIVWYMQQADHRVGARLWQMPAAVAALREMGLKAELAPGKLPPALVAGAQIGSADCAWPPGVAISAGAIVENLASFGGMIQPWGGQTGCADPLLHGAAGSSGTVNEPMAIQSKFPEPAVQVHYARGATLAEALWLSTTGPYQTIMLGDPLCAPYARPPRFAAEISERDGALDVRLRADDPVRTVRIWRDGVPVWEGRATDHPRIDTREWPQGACALAVVGLADTPIETQARVSSVLTRGSPPRLAIATPAATWGGRIAVTVEQPCRIRGGGEDFGPAAPGSPLAIPTTSLGLGATSLTAVILDADSQIAAISAPLTVMVEAPTFPASAQPPPGGPARWRSGRERGALRGLATGVWLPNHGLGGQAVAIDAWLRVDETGLHQLQLCGGADRSAALVIDGQAVPLVGKGWRSAPLHLAAGWHRLVLDLGPGDPHLELRFGRQGIAPVDFDRWRGEATP